MQNRNMFLYRRQGPKKRAKTGTPRKGRGPQKGLPNSARDLLPLIQPATKALAQMLAGRTGVSGQLGHAQAVLAQTERLLADRAHNRLNPVEREEFFEQIARLRLTLSDAESEAEFKAAEKQAPAPIAVPVDRERLKAMAMALTTSSASATTATDKDDFEGSANGTPNTPGEDQALDIAPAAQDIPLSSDEDGSKTSPIPAAQTEKRASDPTQLRLPREASDKLVLQPGSVALDPSGRRRKPKLSPSSRSKISSPITTKGKTAAASADDEAVMQAEANHTVLAEPEPSKTATIGTVKAQSGQKLPKGWIIDDEGFVVPGPS